MPMACFLALPALAYRRTFQPSGQQGNNVRRARPQQERAKFDPIPMTYTELYPKLIQCNSLVPMDIPPMQPRYPRWYNENARCDYHYGNRGHSTKDCIALKRKIHDLIKARALAFDNEDVLDVNRNLFSDHQRPKINAVGSDPELLIEKDIRIVCMPMEIVHEALFKTGLLDEKQKKKKENEDWERQYYQYHKRSVGHSIQDCQDFLGLVQEMMNKEKIEFYKETKGQAMNVL